MSCQSESNVITRDIGAEDVPKAITADCLGYHANRHVDYAPNLSRQIICLLSRFPCNRLPHEFHPFARRR